MPRLDVQEHADFLTFNHIQDLIIHFKNCLIQSFPSMYIFKHNQEKLVSIMKFDYNEKHIIFSMHL